MYIQAPHIKKSYFRELNFIRKNKRCQITHVKIDRSKRNRIRKGIEINASK